jgi:hypothetical protein
VTFEVIEATTYGETVYIAGSIPQLGNWSPSSAVALSASDYTSSNNMWFATVNLLPGTSFQYKYLIISSSAAVTWEADPNRSFTVSTTESQEVQDDTWQG